MPSLTLPSSAGGATVLPNTAAVSGPFAFSPFSAVALTDSARPPSSDFFEQADIESTSNSNGLFFMTGLYSKGRASPSARVDAHSARVRGSEPTHRDRRMDPA